METIGAKALEDFADNIKVRSPFPFPGPACSRALGTPQRAGLPESQLGSQKGPAVLAPRGAL